MRTHSTRARPPRNILRLIPSWLRRNSLARQLRRTAKWWIELGTKDYPPDIRRRLQILNAFAALIAVATAAYAVQNAFMDLDRHAPVVIINTALLIMALSLPQLHRFGPIAAGLTLVVCEFAALLALSAYLGRDAGLQLQYFIAAAVAFFILGLERLRLVLAIVAAAIVLHLMVWFHFPAETALARADPELAQGLYLQAAITTMAMIAATVWYAFRLVEQARGETETLLRNILPDSIVERLKLQPDEPIADTFDDATVLFADISGFVPLSRQLGAAGVVALLNELVREFDALAARHGIEKIKTIGDAYMAAGGVPVGSGDHTGCMVLLALDMLAVVARIRAEQDLGLHMRVGIAQGPVMAGVIGTHKFSYDVWGDTVNLASRLESMSTPGRIMVCGNCRKRLDERFSFESAGVIEIKGIGRTEAWLVEVSEHRPHRPPAATPCGGS